MSAASGSSIPPPPPFVSQALPPFWTEHLAPAGHSYWYNSQTKISTYSRPLPPPPSFASFPPASLPPSAPTELAPVKEKKEKPKTKTIIGESDWTRVVTNKGNTFYTNRTTKESVWSVPGEIRDQVIALELLESGEKESDSTLIDDDGVSDRKRKLDAELVEESQKAIPVEVIEEKHDDVKEEAVTESGAVVSEEPPTKRKKVKKQIVRSIEELETDEDWQRSVAAQMAEEVAEAEKLAVKPEVVDMEPVPALKVNISSDEGIALFKAMLLEKNIEPFAPWDDELPKFINDSRYNAVRALKDRRDLFDQFCKEKIRGIRAAKKAAGDIKTDPLTAYKSLLKSEITSTRTHFSDFKKAHQKDPRFRDFGKTEGEKEKVFKSFLRELGEKKREDGIKADKRFAEMLSETMAKAGDEWNKVKTSLTSDPRYLAVASSSHRATLFDSYLLSLKFASPSSTSVEEIKKIKEDKAARAIRSLKDREEQVTKAKSSNLRQMESARGQMGREEGEREFGTLLVDQVRDHESSWESVSSAISQDPRFSTLSLSDQDKKRLFDAHLSHLYNKRLTAVSELFLAHSPSLITPFHQVLPEIVALPSVVRLVGPSQSGSDTANLVALEAVFDRWSRGRTSKAKEDFNVLLKENPILEHWGRLQKTGGEVVEGGMKDGGAEDEDEGGGDEILGLKEMAMQIDLKAVEAVLKHDKRYLVFDHIPDERSQWIDEFISNLAAPKATVHQRT